MKKILTWLAGSLLLAGFAVGEGQYDWSPKMTFTDISIGTYTQEVDSAETAKFNGDYVGFYLALSGAGTVDVDVVTSTNVSIGNAAERVLYSVDNVTASGYHFLKIEAEDTAGSSLALGTTNEFIYSPLFADKIRVKIYDSEATNLNASVYIFTK